MTKRSTALVRGIVLATAVSTLGLAGSASAKTTIDWWFGLGGALGDVVQQLVTKYNTSQADFEVKATYKGSYAETMTAVIAAYRAKNAPHIVQIYEVGTQTMMMSGAIYPVHELMDDTNTKVKWDRFVDPVLAYYSKGGKLFSMPFNSSTPILYYNKDVFAAAGLDPNKPPKTWPEVEAYSKKILAAKKADYGFSVGWPSWTMVENMHAWHGLAIATQDNGYDGLDAKLTVNDKFGIMHIGQLAAWQKDNIFKYGGRAGAADPLFVNGQAAMYIQSSAIQGGLAQTAKFSWGTAQLPHWGSPYPKTNSIIGGATLWVMKGAKAKEYEGVADFLSFISRGDIQAEWHKKTGYVPISEDAQGILEKEGYYTKSPNQRTAYEQLTNAKSTANTRGIRLGNFVQIRDIIEEEMENIFAGKKTAKGGLDDAVNRSNTVLRTFEDLYKK